jgi:hypothetical protein
MPFLIHTCPPWSQSSYLYRFWTALSGGRGDPGPSCEPVEGVMQPYNPIQHKEACRNHGKCGFRSHVLRKRPKPLLAELFTIENLDEFDSDVVGPNGVVNALGGRCCDVCRHTIIRRKVGCPPQTLRDLTLAPHHSVHTRLYQRPDHFARNCHCRKIPRVPLFFLLPLSAEGWLSPDPTNRTILSRPVGYSILCCTIDSHQYGKEFQL